MSILDPTPKTSVKLLVGRDRELKEVVRSVVEHRITIVLGPRRIGKTSLVKVALSVLSGRDSLADLPLNGRFVSIYVDMWDVISVSKSRNHFFEYLSNAVDRALEEYDPSLAREYRRRISLREEVSVKEGGIDAIVRGRYAKEERLVYPRRPERCLEELNNLLGERKAKVVLAIDEAQELGTVKPFSPAAWLAHVHDHLTQVHVLLSGSYVGLLKRVLRPSPRDPLYGRDVNRVNVGKLSPDGLLTIFARGLEERGVYPSREFSESLGKAATVLREAAFVQLLPLAEVPLPRAPATMPPRSIKEVSRLLEAAVYLLLDPFLRLGILSSILVYLAANILMRIGFDLGAFSSTLPEDRRKLIEPLMRLTRAPGFKTLMVLSLFALSGSPSLVISLVRRLPDGFREEDLFEAGLQVLDESYRAVCGEINNFIRSHSKKPEIMLSILYGLYERPRTTSELVGALPDVEKKSVVENLKVLLGLGYVDKRDEGVHTYYYIIDPLLFYALRERCVTGAP